MAKVAMIAPSTSISRMAGSAILAMRGPSVSEEDTNCCTSNNATDDMGDIAQPVQKACRQLVPLPQLAAPTPTTLATPRASTRAATRPATAGFQSALAATTDTSTNISIVSSDAAVPNCRGQAQGRGLSCLSIIPPSRAANGADPPKCAARAVPAAISVISSIEVFSLVGVITRSAMRSASASNPATTNDTPRTTATGKSVSLKVVVGRCITPARALTSVSAYRQPRVDSTIARSVTGPDACVSIMTRDSTAGDATIAIRARASDTVGRTPIHRKV